MRGANGKTRGNAHRIPPSFSSVSTGANVGDNHERMHVGKIQILFFKMVEKDTDWPEFDSTVQMKPLPLVQFPLMGEQKKFYS